MLNISFFFWLRFVKQANCASYLDSDLCFSLPSVRNLRLSRMHLQPTVFYSKHRQKYKNVRQKLLYQTRVNRGAYRLLKVRQILVENSKQTPVETSKSNTLTRLGRREHEWTAAMLREGTLRVFIGFYTFNERLYAYDRTR